MKKNVLPEISCLLEQPVFEEPLNVIIPNKITGTDNLAIASVLTTMMVSGDYAIDHLVRDMEISLESYLKLKKRKLFLLSHGRIAMLCAFDVLEIGNHPYRNEVVCQSFAYNAVLDVISMRRLKPVFIDIEPSSLNIDPDSLRKSLSPKTAAVVIVDNYGLPNNYRCVKKIIDEYSNGIKLIIDSAESFGAMYHGMPIGHFGDAVVLSFSFSKPLQCGKGGGLIVPDKVAESIIRKKEMEKSVWFKGCQLDPFKAFTLHRSLDATGSNIVHRNKIAQIYKTGLNGLPGLTFQHIPGWAKSVHTHFPVVLDPVKFGLNRDMLKQILSRLNINTKEYFQAQHHIAGLEGDQELPVTEFVARNVIALPIGTGISVGQARQVCHTIQWIYNNRNEVLIACVGKWNREAYSSLENGRFDIALSLFELLQGTFANIGSLSWERHYARCVRLAKRKIIPKGTFYRLLHDELLLCNDTLRTPSVNSTPLYQAIGSITLARAALEKLEKGDGTGAYDFYEKVALLYRDLGHKSLEAAYHAAAGTLRFCSGRARNDTVPSVGPIKKDDAVLVIGASGFVGRYLMKKLLDEGFSRVIGVGITRRALEHEVNYTLDYNDSITDEWRKEIDFHALDIRRPDELTKLLQAYGCKAIVNLAPFSDTRFFNAEPGFSMESMLGHGLRAMIDYSLSGNVPLLQMSTAMIYGNNNHYPNTEASEIDGFESFYTESKRMLELFTLQSGAPAVILRCANIFGRGDNVRKVIPFFIERARMGATLYASDDKKEFLHVGDVVEALLAILLRGCPGGIFNLGSGTGTSIRALAEKIRDLCSCIQGIPSHIVCSDRPGSVKLMDSSKLRTILNWKPMHTLEYGLAELIKEERTDCQIPIDAYDSIIHPE